MNEAQHSNAINPANASPDAALTAAAACKAPIAALRAAGAAQFDPVHMHYLETLAKRASAHQGNIRRALDAKLERAAAAFQERFEQALGEARQTLAQSSEQYPHAAGDLRRLFAAGDFKGLRQLIATLKAREQTASLGALVRQLEQHSSDHAGAPLEERSRPRAELKTLRKDRGIWAKLSVDNQVAQALKQAPKNAGPINSHMLMLRSLALMRDISPDYLKHFISYADTLLCLDQGEKETPPAQKKPRAAKAAKK